MRTHAHKHAHSPTLTQSGGEIKKMPTRHDSFRDKKAFDASYEEVRSLEIDGPTPKFKISRENFQKSPLSESPRTANYHPPPPSLDYRHALRKKLRNREFRASPRLSTDLGRAEIFAILKHFDYPRAESESGEESTSPAYFRKIPR